MEHNSLEVISLEAFLQKSKDKLIDKYFTILDKDNSIVSLEDKDKFPQNEAGQTRITVSVKYENGAISFIIKKTRNRPAPVESKRLLDLYNAFQIALKEAEAEEAKRVAAEKAAAEEAKRVAAAEEAKRIAA